MAQREAFDPARFRVLGSLQVGGGVRAVLRLVEHRGVLAVWKDFSASRWCFRHSAGAYLAGREAAAYRAVRGVAGVPRLLGRVGCHGLLLEHVDGVNARVAPADAFTPSFFEELSEILRAVRSHGVLHLDVKRNVLSSKTGRPYLIDFATSVVLPPWLGRLRRYALRVAAAYDDRDVVQLKRLVAPHLVTPQDEAALARPVPLAGTVGFLQGLIQGGVRGLTGQQTRPFLPPTNPPNHPGDDHAPAA